MPFVKSGERLAPGRLCFWRAYLGVTIIGDFGNLDERLIDLAALVKPDYVLGT